MAETPHVDHLHARLFRPWSLLMSEWPLAREDWTRVEIVCALPWKGRILDVGSGDGTLGALVASRNPGVCWVSGVDSDPSQVAKAETLWRGWPAAWGTEWPDGMAFDGAIVGELLEHLSPDEGAAILARVHAACKPGALVCVTVPCADGSRAHSPGHVRTFTVASLRAMLEEAGLHEPGLSVIQPRPDEPAIWIMAVCRI